MTKVTIKSIMIMKKSFLRFLYFALISLGFLSGCTPLSNSPIKEKPGSQIPQMSLFKKYKEGQWINNPTNLVYIPATNQASEKFPVIVIFSPEADAVGTLNYWQKLADEKRYILIGSKTYKNGYTDEQIKPIIAQNHSMIFQTLRNLPVQPGKIILAGLSGGGSFSHSLNINRPGSYNTLIVNVGRIWESDFEKARKNYFRLKETFSERKNTIVFLASPGDFRYEEMKRDAKLMQGLGWRTQWIEFPGGHKMAPIEKYAEALSWIEAQNP